MERSLYHAAREGNMNSLLILLHEDPLALERSYLPGAYEETPLHIATILGQVEFAREILERKADLASKLDMHKSMPLHLAAGTSNLELVQLVYKANPAMCLERDKYGRNPVHIAAIKGGIDVFKWLLQVNCPPPVDLITDDGDTILHLCVRYGQVEALTVLVEDMGDMTSIPPVMAAI